jgi:hypothetical protein
MDPKLEKWIELVSTLIGAIGLVLTTFGLTLIFAGFRLWIMWQHK